jgi:hypothetical protein
MTDFKDLPVIRHPLQVADGGCYQEILVILGGLLKNHSLVSFRPVYAQNLDSAEAAS